MIKLMTQVLLFLAICMPIFANADQKIILRTVADKKEIDSIIFELVQHHSLNRTPLGGRKLNGIWIEPDLKVISILGYIADKIFILEENNSSEDYIACSFRITFTEPQSGKTEIMGYTGFRKQNSLYNGDIFSKYCR